MLQYGKRGRGKRANESIDMYTRFSVLFVALRHGWINVYMGWSEFRGVMTYLI